MASVLLPSKNGVRIRIKVKPRASKSQILGIRGDVLWVAVTEAPEKGKANASVCALIAEMLHIPQSRVKIVQGATSTLKTVDIAGISLETAEILMARVLPRENPG